MQDFEEIFEEYYQLVYKYMLGLCRNPNLAEEITQETFFKAYKSIDRFKGECKISTWLCGIAKNSYYGHMKREQVRKKHAVDIDPIYEIEERFQCQETAQDIHRVLHQLREPYREVFWLKTFGELSFREIGDLFGKSESWGRVTYYRAKIMIKEGIK